MCRSQGLEVGEGTASTNRSRQLPTVAEDTPCRRAASASDNSPFNTANTIWICSSTDTCRDGFCCLLTQPSFPIPQPNPRRKFDSLQVDIFEYIFDIVSAM